MLTVIDHQPTSCASPTEAKVVYRDSSVPGIILVKRRCWNNHAVKLAINAPERWALVRQAHCIGAEQRLPKVYCW